MYKPLDSRLTISKSGINGLGLFATADIPKNVCLGITHIKSREFERGYIRTPLGGLYNHSESPNCKKVAEGLVYKLWTLKVIKTGEELTAHYTFYKPK